MKAEEARHIIDLEMSVSEKTYNALPPGDLKTALTDARTTKLSVPSLKIRFNSASRTTGGSSSSSAPHRSKPTTRPTWKSSRSTS
jgi:hypothetical protein